MYRAQSPYVWFPKHRLNMYICTRWYSQLGIITASSEESQWVKGIHAFDGSINSYWKGKSAQSWLVYDAGRRRVVLSYKIATKHTGCPRQWEFQGSNNFYLGSVKARFDVLDAQTNGICHRARFAHYGITGRLNVRAGVNTLHVQVFLFAFLCRCRCCRCCCCCCCVGGVYKHVHICTTAA